MPESLPKGFEPRDVEKKWIDYWNDNQSFTPSDEPGGKSYSIVIPPPNVTGTLHMGHALNLTLQDILCRYHRQQGYDVLWVPGTDHAGIATQNVVEKSLAAQGTTRQDLGREEFVRQVWQWKEEYGGKILNQISRIGASVDWSRLRFTMDDGLSRAVREVFVKLYEQGLIYQGDYIINWCIRCHTALSDLEMEYSEVDGGLYHLRYPLEDGSGHLVVATTRPETMLGDTAVAVNPEDERYRHLIGKNAVLPFLNRRLPIIGDEYVDMEFGTGCLKITPAHDPNDFELGRKHGLELIQVIDDLGAMTPEAGEQFAGLDRMECRKKILQELKEKDLLESSAAHRHSVGHCYRCSAVLEPYVSRQWFVKVGPLASKARDAVSSGDTRIVPGQWAKTYFEWMDNIRDWCISRQIWWGHRIPAWTCLDCGELMVTKEDPTVCTRCESSRLEQDQDVLDTWFSSALWPFSTLGWPDDTRDLQKFYPTSVLVTAFDILFFWVARMMMMGVHFMEQVPFRDVYIHALVRDASGQKMSKSKGNVIDPLLMMDKYGTDAFRFTLTSLAAMGRDIKMSEDRVEGYRHFINKIWNAARFSLMHLQEPPRRFHASAVDGLAHQWILHRLEEVKDRVRDAVENYRFNDAAQTMYQFVWHSFCDWYLELIKPELYGEDEAAKEQARSNLSQVLSEIIILLHPMIPFATQEIWSRLPGRENQDLSRELYPEKRPQCSFPEAADNMEFLQQVVTAVRGIRSELNIAPGLKLELLMQVDGPDRDFLMKHRDLIQGLAGLGDMQTGMDLEPPRGCGAAVVKGYELFVPLKGVVDIQSELARLQKELGKLEKDLSVVGKKLENPGFLNNAPADVVEKEQAKANRIREEKEKLQALYTRLEGIQQE
ncbi:valyl-tRNA synthetase [Desulfonatronospira thiodismutans ASO3-1]|uniref:Valine--tRNA ligase n=2 Tax=Desulfonatronospira TaxID=488937 RepID=D6SSX1_9BACT|nr:valine--tRNA ligase [Desulfonatronospira thiodismutans]EFI33787.1 valyl-tRNA synthetase [Desulfonatronospira thiodismutans ASO3-1]